jgi:DNA mismatch endonuclease (patch repair protein)
MRRNSVTSDGERRPFKAVEKRLAGRHRLVTTRGTSKRMAKVRRKGTAPEILVRKALSWLGYRYTLNNEDLPGSPDLANRSKKWVVFVHGCYWHHHAGCPRATTPKSNRPFWLAKFAANRVRDMKAAEALAGKQYLVITLWECECSSERIYRAVKLLRSSRPKTLRGTEKRRSNEQPNAPHDAGPPRKYKSSRSI